MKSPSKYLFVFSAYAAIFAVTYFIYTPVLEDDLQVMLRVKLAWMLTVAIAAITFLLLRRLPSSKKGFGVVGEIPISFFGVHGVLTIPPLWKKIGAGAICVTILLDGLATLIYGLKLLDPIFYICAFVDRFMPFVNAFFLLLYNGLYIFPKAEMFVFQYGWLIVQQLLLFGVSLSFFKILTSRLIARRKFQ